MKPLVAGVLMIGSLYWGDEGGRDQWRRSRLDDTKKWYVHVPIYYGRPSYSRGNTYTMVFGRLEPSQFGQAIVVQCKRLITSIDDVIEEARWLWGAETKGEHRQHADAACSTWGSVAIMPNHSIADELVEAWRKRSGAVTEDEDLLIRTGQLDIPWPLIVDDNSPLPLDLLLATTNKPTSLHSNPREIAEAWNEHGFRDYFEENQEAGIVTFQDEEIRGWLK
jgi:hypothetical protein